MPSSGLELVAWKLNQPTTIQEEIAKRLAETAKSSRQVVPKGPDSIGQQAVVVPTLLAGPPVVYGPDRIVTPVHVYVDTMLNDQRAADPASIQNAIGSAAAQLGVIEDQEVLLGWAGAPLVPVPPAPASPFGRFARNAAMARDGLALGPGVVPALVPLPGPIPIGAAPGVNPNGDQLNLAIIAAVAALQVANRPGQLGLLVSHNLMATLQLARPAVPGGPPLIREVEGRIGNKIVATSALVGAPPYVGICGVLLRLAPAAADVVQTQLPTVTVLGRAAGLTHLRVEEEIAVRLLDPTAIQTILY